MSRVCLRLRDTALDINLPFDMCRWLVEGEDVEGVRIAVAAITQACAVANQGESNDLQHL